METENVNVKNWKSLLKPAKLDLQLSDDKSYAKIIAEPLEKGYGLTLGNSLRRILLSSMPGAAITDVTIEGISHEYSTIEGVREDVIDILLNLKDMPISLIEGTSAVIKLDVSGPCEVTSTHLRFLAMLNCLMQSIMLLRSLIK